MAAARWRGRCMRVCCRASYRVHAWSVGVVTVRARSLEHKGNRPAADPLWVIIGRCTYAAHSAPTATVFDHPGWRKAAWRLPNGVGHARPVWPRCGELWHAAFSSRQRRL